MASCPSRENSLKLGRCCLFYIIYTSPICSRVRDLLVDNAENFAYEPCNLELKLCPKHCLNSLAFEVGNCPKCDEMFHKIGSRIYFFLAIHYGVVLVFENFMKCKIFEIFQFVFYSLLFFL